MKHYNAKNPPLVADSEITDGEQSTAQEKYVSYIQSYLVFNIQVTTTWHYFANGKRPLISGCEGPCKSEERDR